MNLRYAFKELTHQQRRTVIPVLGLYFGIALSLLADGLASYFMGRHTAKMKPADILRRL